MTVVVRGEASDPGEIVELTVAGLAAASEDGFRTWRAEVPLPRGARALPVRARNAAGGTTVAELELEGLDPALAAPNGIDYDEATDSAWVIDRTGRVLRIAAGTGARSRVDTGGIEFDRMLVMYSDNVMQELFPMPPPFGIAHGAAEGALWVSQMYSIVRVDLATGTRQQFANGGDYLDLGSSRIASGAGVARDGSRNRLLVCDSWSHRLVAMDLSTGVQSVVVDGKAGLRDAIAFDPASREVYAIHEPLRAIHADTGTVREIPTPEGAPLLSSSAVGACLGPGGLYVADPEMQAVLEIDVRTGERRLLAGTGPELLHPRGMALDSRRQRLLVLDDAHDAIVAISLATGERALLGGVTAGGGPPLDGVVDLARDTDGALLALTGTQVLRFAGASRAAIAEVGTPGRPTCLAAADGALFAGSADPAGLHHLDPLRAVSLLGAPNDLVAAHGALYVLEGIPASIARVDPVTGAREIVSDATHGTGPALSEESAMALDPVTGRLLATGVVEDLIAVDPFTGARERIVLDSGPAIAVDAAGRRAFLVRGFEHRPRAGALVVVDLVTAATRVVKPEGMAILDPVAAQYDEALDAVLVADRAWGGVLAVAAADGESFLLAR